MVTCASTWKYRWLSCSLVSSLTTERWTVHSQIMKVSYQAWDLVLFCFILFEICSNIWVQKLLNYVLPFPIDDLGHFVLLIYNGGLKLPRVIIVPPPVHQMNSIFVSIGHPRFFNQLSSGLDIIGLAGEWLTSTANTNMWVTRCHSSPKQLWISYYT